MVLFKLIVGSFAAGTVCTWLGLPIWCHIIAGVAWGLHVSYTNHPEDHIQ